MGSRKKVSTVPTTPRRASLHNLIFEAETKAGKTLDIILMTLIALSVATVMLDSVTAVRGKYGELLHYLEWFFAFVFAIEYVLRLVATLRPWRYALSFLALRIFLQFSKAESVFYSQVSHTCLSFESSESFEFCVFSSFWTTCANGQCC